MVCDANWLVLFHVLFGGKALFFLNPHVKMVAGFVIGHALNLVHLFCKSIFAYPVLRKMLCDF